MKRKFVLGIGIGAIVGGISSTLVINALPNITSNYYSENKAKFLEHTITSSFIKENNIQKDKLVDGIYKGFVYGVEDPYTVYLNKEDFNKNQVMDEGNYIGHGIRFSWGLSKQYLIVTGIIPGSPAEDAGIKVGDKIVAIDKIKAIMSNEVEIMEKITYTGNKKINYTIKDNSETTSKDVALQAREVKIKGMSPELIANHIGYIKLESMKDGLSLEVKQAIETLKAEGANQWIIDVRGLYANNIDEAVKLCDLFLEKGMFFKIEYTDKTVKSYEATEGGYKEPLVVLADSFTSGTIEGFVSAIKLQNRGAIIGGTTSGKGTVEELISLNDGTGLMVTTGVIFAKDGQSMKDRGVEPTVEERTPTSDTLKILTKGSLPLEEDSQIQKAIGYLK